MAQSDQVIIEIDAGEDFAAQLYWLQDNGDPQNITSPCRMDVRDSAGTLLTQFKTGNTASTQACITLSSTAGYLQLSAPNTVTRSLQPGTYVFDLFATLTGGNSPFTTQQVPVCSGYVVVKPRVTIMEA